MMPPPPTRRSASEPDITLDKPDEAPPDPRRYLLFCGDENRCMLKALLRVNDVCYDRPQVWTALHVPEVLPVPGEPPEVTADVCDVEHRDGVIRVKDLAAQSSLKHNRPNASCMGRFQFAVWAIGNGCPSALMKEWAIARKLIGDPKDLAAFCKLCDGLANTFAGLGLADLCVGGDQDPNALLL